MRWWTRLRREEDGNILYLTLIMMMLLTAFTLVLVNVLYIGVMKVKAQNAADQLALSAGTLKARLLNKTSNYNALLYIIRKFSGYIDNLPYATYPQAALACGLSGVVYGVHLWQVDECHRQIHDTRWLKEIAQGNGLDLTKSRFGLFPVNRVHLLAGALPDIRVVTWLAPPPPLPPFPLIALPLVFSINPTHDWYVQSRVEIETSSAIIGGARLGFELPDIVTRARAQIYNQGMPGVPAGLADNWRVRLAQPNEDVDRYIRNQIHSNQTGRDYRGSRGSSWQSRGGYSRRGNWDGIDLVNYAGRLGSPAAGQYGSNLQYARLSDWPGNPVSDAQEIPISTSGRIDASRAPPQGADTNLEIDVSEPDLAAADAATDTSSDTQDLAAPSSTNELPSDQSDILVSASAGGIGSQAPTSISGGAALDRGARQVDAAGGISAADGKSETLLERSARAAAAAARKRAEELGAFAKGTKDGFLKDSNAEKEFLATHRWANQKSREAQQELEDELVDLEAKDCELDNAKGLRKYAGKSVVKAQKGAAIAKNIFKEAIYDIPKLGQDLPDAWQETKTAGKELLKGNWKNTAYAGGKALGILGQEGGRLGGAVGRAAKALKGAKAAVCAGKAAKRADKAADAARVARRVGKNSASKARYIYDVKNGRYRDLKTGKFVAKRELPYPKNRGFKNSKITTIKPGTEIDRYGKLSGSYAGQPGASVSQRGMPPGPEKLPYRKFRVVKKIPVEVGPAAEVPEFAATGGAKQYNLYENSIEYYLKKGYLEEIK